MVGGAKIYVHVWDGFDSGVLHLHYLRRSGCVTERLQE